MTRKELVDRLERIKDSMDMDFLNRQRVYYIIQNFQHMDYNEKLVVNVKKYN